MNGQYEERTRTKVRAAPLVFFSPPSSKLHAREYNKHSMKRDETHCLQRFSASCILYLHTVHSNLSTTFLVVLACTPCSTLRTSASHMHAHLFVEHGFRLTTITWLLAVISTLSLHEQRVFALLILGDLVWAAAVIPSVHAGKVGRRARTCAFCTVCPCSLASMSCWSET